MHDKRSICTRPAAGTDDLQGAQSGGSGSQLANEADH